MANTPGGSFIPKRSTGKVTPVRAGRRIYLFSYIAYVFFFGTLLSVIGIFILNQQAENQLQEYILLVQQEQESVNRDQIDSIRELDARIETAEQVLNWHAAPSILFEELQSVIVTTVQLDQFLYTRETGGGVTLSFGGLTDTFDVLLFQRDVMESNRVLAAADITEVSYGVAGTNIEGASRGANEAPQTFGETTVTFVFEDEQVLQNIGYTPREQRGLSDIPNDTEEAEFDSETSIEGDIPPPPQDTDVPNEVNE